MVIVAVLIITVINKLMRTITFMDLKMRMILMEMYMIPMILSKKKYQSNNSRNKYKIYIKL